MRKDLKGQILVKKATVPTDPDEIVYITEHIRKEGMTVGYTVFPIATIYKGIINFHPNQRYEADASYMDFRKLNKKEKSEVAKYIEENPEIVNRVENILNA